MSDAFGLLVLTSPVWLIQSLGVAYVCKSAATQLRRNQRPGWWPSFAAWGATAVLLCMPLMLVATRADGLWSLRVLLPMVALTAIPFFGSGLLLNYRIPPQQITTRIGQAVAAGFIGVTVVVFLGWRVLDNAGVEMFP